MSEERRVLTDNTQVAYLVSQKKYPLQYKAIHDCGDVKFLLEGNGLSHAIDNFFANDVIPVQDFIGGLSIVRTMVQAMKAGRRG